MENQNIIEVWVKGDAWTPHSLWDHALITEEIHKEAFTKNGWFFHKGYTQEYLDMTEEKREQVKFNYINLEKQIYSVPNTDVLIEKDSSPRRITIETII